MNDGMKRFFAYARERHTVYLRRQRGEEVWTADTILQKYRFCNVFRELDRTTIWVNENLRTIECRSGPGVDLFRALAIFRYINRIETGQRLLPILRHQPQMARKLVAEVCLELRRMVANGESILGAAYMIKTPVGKDKVTGLGEIWSALLPQSPTLVEDWCRRPNLQRATESLSQFHYVGPFMAYEIATDLRHTPILDRADDIMEWANPGPGAMRGAARVMGMDLNPGALSRGKRKDVACVLQLMQDIVEHSRDPVYWPQDWPAWEMRDAEHNLCEFDKYERARLGQGEPKQLYRRK